MACAKLKEALDQVHSSIHLSKQGKRRTATFYAGNVEYNASEQDLRKGGEALDYNGFWWRRLQFKEWMVNQVMAS
jgi:hypothetical protein